MFCSAPVISPNVSDLLLSPPKKVAPETGLAFDSEQLNLHTGFAMSTQVLGSPFGMNLW